MLFATTYPDRSRALVMMGGFAKLRRTRDYQIGVPDEVVERTMAHPSDHWGEPDLLALILGSLGS